MNRTRTSPDLDTLVDLFYQSADELGDFQEIDAGETPQPYQNLLVHHEHMTVTVEEYHQSPADVQVVQTHSTDTHYSRKILLTRQSDDRVVQYGIVRLNLDYLGPDVRREIESEETPLGRILIDHDILRDVKLLSIWKISPRADLLKFFELENATTCYGRTALIYCNGVIAVELLEIVSPV